MHIHLHFLNVHWTSKGILLSTVSLVNGHNGLGTVVWICRRFSAAVIRELAHLKSLEALEVLQFLEGALLLFFLVHLVFLVAGDHHLHVGFVGFLLELALAALLVKLAVEGCLNIKVTFTGSLFLGTLALFSLFVSLLCIAQDALLKFFLLCIASLQHGVCHSTHGVLNTSLSRSPLVGTLLILEISSTVSLLCNANSVEALLLFLLETLSLPCFVLSDDALGLLTLLNFLCNLVVLFCLKSCSKSLNFCLLPLAVSQKGLVLSALSFT